MNQWFVYQGEGSHVGPVSTELLVRGVAAGRVPKDAHVAMAGSTEWAPLMTIEEIASALGIANEDAPPNSLELQRVAPTRVPPDELEAEADPTEVIRRDEMLKAGLAMKSRTPSKPPMLVRSTNAPPLRPSASMAIAPSKPAMAVAKPIVASTPPPPPPPPKAASTSGPPPPPVPDPPNTLTMLQPQPPPFAPPPAVAAPEAAVVAAPPAPDAPKKPVVDPKVSLWLPLGTFGVFVFLSLIVVAISFLKRP